MRDVVAAIFGAEGGEGDEPVVVVHRTERVRERRETVEVSHRALEAILAKDPARQRAREAEARCAKLRGSIEALGRRLASLEASATRWLEIAHPCMTLEDVALDPCFAGSAIQDVAREIIAARADLTANGVHGRGGCVCTSCAAIVADREKRVVKAAGRVR